MNVRNVFEDKLSVLSVSAGVFLVLVALGSAVSRTWQYAFNTTAAALQILGLIALILLGAGLVWLGTHSE